LACGKCGEPIFYLRRVGVPRFARDDTSTTKSNSKSANEEQQQEQAHHQGKRNSGWENLNGKRRQDCRESLLISLVWDGHRWL